MSARETLADSPLFPMPLEDEQEGTRHAHGYCAWWCHIAQDFVLPNGPDGNTVEEHHDEPFCIGQVGIGLDALGPRGESTYVGVELIAAYTHGFYPDGVHGLSSSVAITLSSNNDHADEGLVILEPSQVRSLAATLLRAADQLEGLAPKGRRLPVPQEVLVPAAVPDADVHRDDDQSR